MTKKSIESTYKKLTEIEHVLQRSGIYVGEKKKHIEEMWIYDEKKQKIVKKNIEFSPAFLKIFDEILTNATDHSTVDSTVTNIKVDINVESGEISVFNNGKGIPIVIHKEYGIYIPELIFGNLRTSTNYNDEEKRIVGGTNGLGAKLTNIFSKSFKLETVDSENKLKFYQEYSNNMSEKTKPKITKNLTKSYTKISYIPDYKQFGFEKMTNDLASLLKKRVFDCIACTNKNVSIYLNDTKITGKGLKDYVYYYKEKDCKIYYDSFVSQKHENWVWEWVVIENTSSDSDYEQISFVNGINTYSGGKHIEYLTNTIISKLKAKIETKNKVKDIQSKMIKDNLLIFLRATIENPSFNSQCKEALTTQVKDFGDKIEISDSFISKLYKSEITAKVVDMLKLKERMDLSKATDGVKKSRLFIEKLDDASWAGTTKSDMCSLFVTEGLSASTFAKWGIKIIGSEKYGVYPLKGKVLNVRDASMKQLLDNEEINHLKQILGLKQDMIYTKETIKTLRYGKLILLTDADSDGIHISSLILNVFHYWWPSLLTLNYVQKMITPIVKVKDGKVTKEFYNLQDLEKFTTVNTNKSAKYNYYKGLGTWEKLQCQDLFRNNFDNLLKQYYAKDNECNNSMKLAFEKEKIKGEVSWPDKRKEWLGNYDKNVYIPKSQEKISLKEMVNKELIHFSIYDNSRSIPSFVDGLKPSQRKILYYMLNKNIVDNIKVAQLSGYVSAETSYHHGEMSLQKAIVGMAQNFIGSNNMNLLYPSGNFGTRPLGGADASSARYIFTRLEPLTKVIFNQQDNELLEYLNDDGMTVEPEHFLPIIPMILVNGCEGIGTGYSTFIPSFSPKDIIDNLLMLMNGVKKSKLKELVPYYKNFKGKILKEEGSWKVNGVWKRKNEKKIEITELPANICNYITFIQNKIKKGCKLIKDYSDNSLDENTNLSIVIEFYKKEDLDKLIQNQTLVKELKLQTSLSVNNMYVFNESLKLVRYSDPNDLLVDFYNYRVGFFEKRRLLLIKKLEYQKMIHSNKIRFITEYLSGTLKINKEKKEVVIAMLVSSKYDKVDDDYKYLYNLPIITLTYEKIKELKTQLDNIITELNTLKNKSHLAMWKEELNALHF